METVFLWYPKCTTCQRAKAFLDLHHIPYQTRNIYTEHPRVDELTQWIKLSGLPIQRFYNTSGILYREMALKHKLPLLSDADKIALLATDGRLVKRPILVSNHGVFVGFRPEQWEQLHQ